MKNFRNIARKAIYGKVNDFGMVRRIGFNREEDYYIDQHTYLFGFRLKTIRYWKKEDLLKGKSPNKDRVIIKGFETKKEVI